MGAKCYVLSVTCYMLRFSRSHAPAWERISEIFLLLKTLTIYRTHKQGGQVIHDSSDPIWVPNRVRQITNHQTPNSTFYSLRTTHCTQRVLP